MAAVPSKKSAVVAIEVARRRLRLRSRPGPPKQSSGLSLTFALAMMVAIAALIIGLRIGSDYAHEGKYWLAAAASLCVIMLGFAPICVVLLNRRRTSEDKPGRPSRPKVVVRLDDRKRRRRSGL